MKAPIPRKNVHKSGQHAASNTSQDLSSPLKNPQEIESRLERSFQEERLLGGADTARLAQLISGAVVLIEMRLGKAWTADRVTWEAVKSAVVALLERFQPSVDFDIWDRHRDEFLRFANAVWKLERILNRIEGLEKAYPDGRGIPSPVEREYKAALEARPSAFQTVKERARGLFDGPLSEQDERRKRAEELGREVAGAGAGQNIDNFVVAGVMRMYTVNGAFEPLPFLNEDRRPPTDQEILECVRKLANLSIEGAPDGNPQA